MTTAHSILVGGSTAERRINCPGSLAATLNLPAGTDIPSDYAEEGTAMHAVMALLMQRRMMEGHPIDPEKLLGAMFHDRILTREHLDTMILPALEALAELEAEYGDGFWVVAVEKYVKFPGLHSAGGTIDLILTNGATALHVDWKFGAGVPVLASYDDEINAQLMFYVTGARAAYRGLYSSYLITRMAGAIIQPRADVYLSFTDITELDIKRFKRALLRAIELGLTQDAPRKKGEWCRFAPCKMTCPLWTGPLLDLSAITDKKLTPSPDHSSGGFGRYLASAKVLVDMAALFKKEIDEQMHAYLQNGGKIPGWRLKAKQKQRQWIDENKVYQALVKLGFNADDIWQRKLQTFQSTDATAKKKGVKIPDELRVAPPSSETTIATTDDPAPEVTPTLAIEQFRASLAALTQGVK
jgi:hypothetical protein